MRHLLFLSILVLVFAAGCGDDEPGGENPGTIKLDFDNVVGSSDLLLAEDGITEYPYQNGFDQPFNLTILRYYISQISLKGADGFIYIDPLEVGPNPEDIKGIYLIDESSPVFNSVSITDVPVGEYNEISFLVGVDSTGVQEGAAGGILDPAADAWFWNWNAGYVALGLEGQSPNATGDQAARTLRPDNPNGFGFHVGGWKDVPGSMFVYNNKMLTFQLTEPIVVSSDETSQLNFTVDVLSLIEGIDFEENSKLHSPLAGTPVSDNIPAAFQLQE